MPSTYELVSSWNSSWINHFVCCFSFILLVTFGGYCFNICYVFRPSQPMSQILRDLRLLCACVCVYEYQYTITCAYISLVLSLFRFHVDLLEQWTVVHYLIWLVCLAACFVFVVFFRLIPFIIMELATEHFVYITLRFRLRLSAALYYVMSNNIDKSHLNGNRAECTSCRAHHGHRQPDNFDDENRGNKWNSCRF